MKLIVVSLRWGHAHCPEIDREREREREIEKEREREMASKRPVSNIITCGSIDGEDNINDAG